MKRSFIAIICIIIIALSGCGSSSAVIFSAKMDGDRAYNVAIISTNPSYSYRGLEESGSGGIQFYQKHTEVQHFYDRDSVQISMFINDYRIYSNGIIEVSTGSGLKFTSSSENIILIYDPVIESD